MTPKYKVHKNDYKNRYITEYNLCAYLLCVTNMLNEALIARII